MTPAMPPKINHKKSTSATPKSSGTTTRENDFPTSCPEDCPVCGNPVSDEEKGIECDDCHSWWHAGCANLTVKEYEIITKKSKYLKFCCDNCVDNDRPKENALQAQLSMMTTMFSTMQQTQLKILDRLEKLESNQKIDSKIEDMVDSKIKEAILDTREREERKLNLIITNIREPEGASLEDKKKSDKEEVNRLIEEITDEKVIISDPIRLGRVNIGTRPRLLRITVQNEESKFKILKNAAKLNRQKDPSKRIYINPDYSVREREAHKKLRQELRERQAKGEQNLMVNYRDCKIVTRPERAEEGDTFDKQ